MKTLFFVYRTGRKNILESVKQHKLPSHMLYGAYELGLKGWDIRFSDISFQSASKLFYFLFYPFQEFFIKISSIGFKIDQALLLITQIKSNNIIITSADSAGLPVLLLKKLKIFKNSIVYISIGFINELDFRKTKIVFRFCRWLFNEADIIICHSLSEVESFGKLMPELTSKVHFVPFGIDTDFFQGQLRDDNYVLSIGHDRSRDFGFLTEVARENPTINFVVITQRSNVEGINMPSNVKLEFNLPYDQVRQYYLNAACVFLPLKEMHRAEGQISFLEALAAGKNVVVTSVEGLKEVYPDLYNSAMVFPFPQNDHQKCTIQLRAASIKKSKLVRIKYTTEYYANIMEDLIQKL